MYDKVVVLVQSTNKISCCQIMDLNLNLNSIYSKRNLLMFWTDDKKKYNGVYVIVSNANVSLGKKKCRDKAKQGFYY